MKINLAPIKTLLADELQPIIVAVSSLLQLSIPLLLSLDSLPTLFWSAPYGTIAGVYFATLLLLLVPLKRNTGILAPGGEQFKMPLLFTKTRSRLIGICTLVGIIASLWTTYELTRTTSPDSNPVIPPPELSQNTFKQNNVLGELMGIRPAAAAEPIVVKASMSFVTDRSSLVAVQKASPKILEIRANPRIEQRLRTGKNNETQLEVADLPDLTKWLRKRAAKLAPAALPHLTGKRHSLTLLSRRRPDLVSRLMPTSEEYKRISNSDRLLALKWVSRYVGQWNPRFRVTVDNTVGQNQVLITGIRFDVQDFWKAKGSAESPPLGVLDTFYFPVRLQTGPQRLLLGSQGIPQLVSKGQLTNFDLVLTPHPDEEEPANPCHFSGQLILETSVGNLSLGQLSLYSYNPWVGGLLAFTRSLR